MEYSAKEQYWIWLSSVEGIGPRRFYQLLSAYGDARTVWESVSDSGMDFLGVKALSNLRKARNERYFYELFARLQNAGVRAVTRISEGYPSALISTIDAPSTLYVKGEADLNAGKCFAIIGSRRCTRDGMRAATEFGEGLALNGVTVISGLASGVDKGAHMGTLKGGGTTIAVLGCGLDTVYPEENIELAESILENGGALISEYLPGTPPVPGNFPARNRIISGMSKGVLIVEGAKRSGAMITVNCALDQGRDVFAVPGSIYSPLSISPNQLISDGAIPALSYWDILEYCGWGTRPGEKARDKALPEMDSDEKAVAQPLSEQALTVTELTSITGFTPQKINSLLTTLELRGIISRQPGGEFRAF